MAKLMVLIVSGPDQPAKIKAGLGFSIVAKQSPELESVKLCFFADGVEILTETHRARFAKLLDKAQELNIVTLACQLHAEQMGIAEEIRRVDPQIDLHYVGEDLVKALTEGYEMVSF
ncbi:MAG: DsrE family protein [Sulfobacillus sp.]